MTLNIINDSTTTHKKILKLTKPEVGTKTICDFEPSNLSTPLCRIIAGSRVFAQRAKWNNMVQITAQPLLFLYIIYYCFCIIRPIVFAVFRNGAQSILVHWKNIIKRRTRNVSSKAFLICSIYPKRWSPQRTAYRSTYHIKGRSRNKKPMQMKYLKKSRTTYLRFSDILHLLFLPKFMIAYGL